MRCVPIFLSLLISTFVGNAVGAPEVRIEHTRNGVLVAARTITLNHLGQADLATLSGTGLPTTTHDPTFRDDGSLASVSLNIGGAVTSASFKDDGTVDSFTHPVLGSLGVSHGFSNGVESLAIHDTTATRALNGTASSHDRTDFHSLLAQAGHSTCPESPVVVACTYRYVGFR